MINLMHKKKQRINLNNLNKEHSSTNDKKIKKDKQKETFSFLYF